MGSSLKLSHESQSALRHPLRPHLDRARDGQEPFLPGAALYGNGVEDAATLAGTRGIKAEGGWGVVNTEYCSIHWTSDDTPFQSAQAWDQDDMRGNALMVEQVHEHGALAGIELYHGGAYAANNFSRLLPIGRIGHSSWVLA